MIANVNGVKMIVENDMVVKDSSKGFFEAETYHTWSLMLNDEDMFIDVGAYTGIYSLVAAKRGLRTLTFEPNPNVYHRLVENIELNDMCHLIGAHNVAVSSSKGKSFLHTKNFKMTSAGSLSQDSEGIPVDVITLDCLQDTIDRLVGTIKIDVEGHELDVLRGGDWILKEHKPDLIIEALSVEKAQEIIDFLKTYNYNSYCVLDDRNYFFEGA
jgi:FkbM family methyltransferase